MIPLTKLNGASFRQIAVGQAHRLPRQPERLPYNLVKGVLAAASLVFSVDLAHAQEPGASGISGVAGVKQEAVADQKILKDAPPPPPSGSAAQGVNKVDGVQTIDGIKANGRDAITPVPPPPPTAPPPPPPTAVTQTASSAAPPPPAAVTQTAPATAPVAPPPPPPTAVTQTASSAAPPPPPPPAAVTQAAPATAPIGTNKVDGVETIQGVKAAGRNSITPPPPPPPPPVTVSSIQAVKGVTGLDAVKRQNLETALQMKEAAGIPKDAATGKGKAAAAALLAAPLEKGPAAPLPKDDGRGGFQEFEKLTTNGS